MEKSKEILYKIEGLSVLYKKFPSGDVEISVLDNEGKWSIYSLSDAYRLTKVFQDVLRANDPDYEEKMIALLSGEKGEVIQ